MKHSAELEERLLVACIEEPHILAALEQLEIDDFYVYANQAAFTAIRNLEAAHVPLSIIAVDSELLRRDQLRNSCVADKAGISYLRDLVDRAQPYGDDVAAALADEKQLRALRAQRDAGAAEVIGEPELAPPTSVEEREKLLRVGWSNMPTRARDELEERQRFSARSLNYHNSFIDDVLRAILPHDLILIGAETGLGKTDLALSIAMANACADRPVAYFALEAEPRELERRSKYAWLSNEAQKRQLPDRNRLNFTDWYLCRNEDIVGSLNADCQRWFDNNLGGFWSFYRGERFNQEDLRREILRIHKMVDLIIVDHLHYVDIEDGDNEGHGIGETMKAIRDVSLRVGKPIILVAHLRKRDERLKKIVPSIGDFHGSSNISKVCTQAITIARARKVRAPKWYQAPTYVSVLKDRRAGAPPYVAMQFFNRYSRTYEEKYVLGELTKGETDWEPIKPGDAPSWARGHNGQLELEFV